MIDASVLNQVAELLKTTDKNLVISAVLKTLMSTGIAVDVAYDMVFGEGAYQKFAGDVYNALRAA